MPASNSPRCFACLSRDRSLKPLLKEKAALMARICPNVAFTKQHMICWECNNVIQKIKQFQSQVLKAQAILQRTATDNNIFPGFSKLKRTEIESLAIPLDTITKQNVESLDFIPPIPRLTPKPNIYPLNIPEPNIHPLNIPEPNIHPLNIQEQNILIKLEPENCEVNIKNEMTNDDIRDFDELIQPSAMLIKPNNFRDPFSKISHKKNNFVEMNWNSQQNKNAITTLNVKPNNKPKSIIPIIKNITPRGSKESVKVTVGAQKRVTIQDTKIYPKTIVKDTKILDHEIQMTETNICPALHVRETKSYHTKQVKGTKIHPTMGVKETNMNPKTVEYVLSQPRPEIEKELDSAKLGLSEFDFGNVIKLVTLNENDMKKYRERKSKGITCFKFSCEKCLDRFNAQEFLDEHNLKHDLSRGIHVCEICEQRFPKAIEKDEHYRNHFMVYECLTCGTRNHDRLNIWNHYRKLHDIDEFQCRTCEEVFSTYKERRRHYRTHYESQTCDKCGKRLRSKSALNIHKRLHMMEKVPCPICSKNIKKQTLQKHIKYAHETPADNNTYWCSDCGTSYKTETCYKMHMNTLKHKTLDELGFKCDHCGKAFSMKSTLLDHFDFEHNDEKYACEICQKECLSKKRLEKHMKFIHQRKKIKEKIRICKLCGKSYKNKKSLECHMNVHLGRRPYKCQDCGDTFSYNASLYTHRRRKHKVKSKRDLDKT